MHGSKLVDGGRMNENKFMGLRKRVKNGELHSAITTHGSKLVGGGRINENTVHGATKKG